jgi:predicted anti-sigma-YlaC factor YlaD
MDTKNCRFLLEDLSDYLDGQASDAVCAEIERHISECENCRIVVDTLNQTLYLYHTLPQPEMPEDLRARLYKSLDLEPYFKPKA